MRKHVSFFTTTLMIAGGILAATNALSPLSATSQDLTDMSIEELMNVEISGATKKPQKTSESAASAVIITRDEIRRYGYRSLGEALQSVTGMYVSSDRNYEYLGVRGFARPGDYDTRILLLIDGHRVNDPNYDNAQIGEDLHVDIEDIDRIEILKGPSSAVWGSNALLGVINLVTKSGRMLNGSNLSLEYGSHNRSKAHAEYGGALGNSGEVSAGISALGTDGQTHIYFPEFDSPDSSYGNADGMDDESAYRTYLKASNRGLTFLFNHGHRTKDIPTASYDTLFNQHGNFTEDEATRFDLSYTTTIDEARRGNIFTRVYWDRVKYYGEYLYASDRPDPDLNHDRSGSSLIGSEVRYSFDATNDLSLLAGLELQNSYDMNFTNITDQPEPELNNSSHDSWTLASLYGEADYEAVTALHLIAGLRLDDYNTIGSSLSPRAGVVWHADSDTTLKLLYGEAFRAPNNYESNYEDEESALANPNITPEELRSYEFIAEHKLSTAQISLSIFRFDMENIITQTVTADDMLQFQNQGTVKSTGVEIAARARLTHDIIGHLGYSFTEAEDRDLGSRISNSPRQTANLALSVPLWGERFYFSPQLNIVGDRLTLQGNHTGTWKVANLVLLSKDLFENFTLSLGVYDLLDDTRYAPGSEEHIQDRLPQDGRTFRAQVTMPIS